MSEARLDALVVGAGPVGLMMAWTLAAAGLRCRVIDAAPEPERESRAIGVQPRTLETFEMAGFVEEFVRRGHRLQAFNVTGRNGDRILRVDFQRLASRYPYLMTLPQNETEQILTRQLQARGVAVERPVKLETFASEADSVKATIVHSDGEKREVWCDWLIGCDGAHSKVRRVLGLPFVGKTYDLQFMLADVEVKTELPESEGYGFSRADGLLATFPMGNGRWRLVADNPAAGWEQREKPSLEEWQTLVDRRATRRMQLTDANWTAYFHVNARMVQNLRRGRVFVLGDAAHVHSPALAQGMNTGLQDAWNLGWKIALVQKGVARTELIDSYEPERLPVERNVLKITDFTQRIVANTDSRVQVVRDAILPLVTRLAVVQNLGRERVTELSIAYRHSPIVQDSWLPSGPHAGQFAPNAEIVVHGETRRLRSLLGKEHVLLALPHPRRAMSEDTRLKVAAITARYGDLLNVYPVVSSAATATPDAIVDVNGEVAQGYGRITAMYLIRPDGYIAYRSGVAQLSKLERYLAKWFVARSAAGTERLAS